MSTERRSSPFMVFGNYVNPFLITPHYIMYIYTMSGTTRQYKKGNIKINKNEPPRRT